MTLENLKDFDRTLFGTKIVNFNTEKLGLILYTWTNVYPRFCGIKFFKHIIHTSIYRSKVIKLEVSLGEMCQKVSNKNVIIQSENITFFHFIITFMITFLNYIELIFIQKCNRYF